jgi:hypothetical protein
MTMKLIFGVLLLVVVSGCQGPEPEPEPLPSWGFVRFGERPANLVVFGSLQRVIDLAEAGSTVYITGAFYSTASPEDPQR